MDISPDRLLAATPLLDHTHPSIENLVSSRGWRELPDFDRIGAVYAFVRDEIAFGFNEAEDLPASRVLAEGVGESNTKATLLMALLRACGVRCRLHGFTIGKALHRGALTGLAYRLAPRDLLHGWVELWFDGRWVVLEGFVLDSRYLRALQKRFAQHQGAFCGFGAAVSDLHDPPVNWSGGDTYVQKDGIKRDCGLFDTPDAFFGRYRIRSPSLKQWLLARVLRGHINRRVSRMRAGTR